MFKVLGLDLGKKLGWAIADEHAVRLSGREILKVGRGESRGMVFVKFTRWFNGMLETHSPALVIYEMPHLRGGDATQSLVGLQTHCMSCCCARSIEYTSVHTGTLKLFATGRGGASKAEMILKAAFWLGREPVDDNEADAVHVARYGVANYAPERMGRGLLEGL